MLARRFEQFGMAKFHVCRAGKRLPRRNLIVTAGEPMDHPRCRTVVALSAACLLVVACSESDPVGDNSTTEPHAFNKPPRPGPRPYSIVARWASR